MKKKDDDLDFEWFTEVTNNKSLHHSHFLR